MSVILYHGSDKEIKHPKFGVGKSDNDYGSGFYTTENIESAREWAVINGNPNSSICNKYSIDYTGLNVMNLDEYGTLAWIAEVVYNRGTDSEETEEMGKLISDKYKIDTSAADIIIGYRADDSYIKVVDAFLKNKLTISEVDKLFREGNLGKQVFIKSEKAFEQLTFLSSEKVQPQSGYGDYDWKARKAVFDFMSSRDRAIQIEGFNVSSQGLIARDAIKQELEYLYGFYMKKETDSSKPQTHNKKKGGGERGDD